MMGLFCLNYFETYNGAQKFGIMYDFISPSSGTFSLDNLDAN